MAYSDFTFSKARQTFGLVIEEPRNLFADIQAISPSDYLLTALRENIPLANAINTEKARSELIIVPVLLEIRRIFDFQVGFFSGIEFNVDPNLGLNGFCDYILTASREIFEIRTPVVMLVEAKNENIKAGLGQCMAEMVSAQLFNQREKSPIESIFGVVTTGTNWKFLRLSNTTLYIDQRDYFINEVGSILGILATPLRSFSLV